MEQTLHAYEIQNDDPINRIYITGGGAGLNNLESLLEEETGIPVERMEVPDDLIDRLGCGEETKDIIATSAGLVFRGTGKKHAIGLNFSRGESLEKEQKETIGRSIYLVIVLILAMLLGSLDFYIRYHDRENRYKFIKTQIRDAYMQTFPEAKTIVNEYLQLKMAVKEMEKKVQTLGGGVDSRLSSLDILKYITEKIPEGVNVNDLLIDKGKIRIQGSTESFESVEKVKRGIEEIPFVTNVRVSDAKLAADQKKVRFRIIMDIGHGKDISAPYKT